MLSIFMDAVFLHARRFIRTIFLRLGADCVAHSLLRLIRLLEVFLVNIISDSETDQRHGQLRNLAFNPQCTAHDQTDRITQDKSIKF